MRNRVFLISVTLLLFPLWAALAAVPTDSLIKGSGSNDYYGAAGAAANDQTAQDEAAGKAVWERLQAKQAACADLKDEDFDKLGDYFMGLMMGGGHAAMNAMMRTQLGDTGEGQMHIVMGKRLSGCDAGAVYPAQGYGYLSMMQGTAGWMMGRTGAYGPYGSSMMAGYPAFSVGYWTTMLLVWVLLILAIVALAKWIFRQKK